MIIFNAHEIFHNEDVNCTDRKIARELDCIVENCFKILHRLYLIYQSMMSYENR